VWNRFSADAALRVAFDDAVMEIASETILKMQIRFWDRSFSPALKTAARSPYVRDSATNGS
jgi:hypothetical protein